MNSFRHEQGWRTRLRRRAVQLPGVTTAIRGEAFQMQRIWRRSRSAAVVSALLVSALLLGASSGVAGADEDGAAGHVYVLNNNLGGENSITSFARAANGSLTQTGV